MELKWYRYFFGLAFFSMQQNFGETWVTLPYPQNDAVAAQLPEESKKVDLDEQDEITATSLNEIFEDAQTNTIIVAGVVIQDSITKKPVVFYQNAADTFYAPIGAIEGEYGNYEAFNKPKYVTPTGQESDILKLFLFTISKAIENNHPVFKAQYFADSDDLNKINNILNNVLKYNVPQRDKDVRKRDFEDYAVDQFPEMFKSIKNNWQRYLQEQKTFTDDQLLNEIKNISSFGDGLKLFIKTIQERTLQKISSSTGYQVIEELIKKIKVGEYFSLINFLSPLQKYFDFNPTQLLNLITAFTHQIIKTLATFDTKKQDEILSSYKKDAKQLEKDYIIGLQLKKQLDDMLQNIPKKINELMPKEQKIKNVLKELDNKANNAFKVATILEKDIEPLLPVPLEALEDFVRILIVTLTRPEYAFDLLQEKNVEPSNKTRQEIINELRATFADALYERLNQNFTEEERKRFFNEIETIVTTLVADDPLKEVLDTIYQENPDVKKFKKTMTNLSDTHITGVQAKNLFEKKMLPLLKKENKTQVFEALKKIMSIFITANEPLEAHNFLQDFFKSPDVIYSGQGKPTDQEKKEFVQKLMDEIIQRSEKVSGNDRVLFTENLRTLLQKSSTLFSMPQRNTIRSLLETLEKNVQLEQRTLSNFAEALLSV